MSIQEALAQLPERLRAGVEFAYNEGGFMVNALMQRGDMKPVRALMAGLAIDRVGRDLFEDALDEYTRVYQELPDEAPEVIVGGGAHAAIWAATRIRMGDPAPLVLEKRERFGGTFAISRNSSFFLNSRNRPGPLGTAGSLDALNVIPGAPMQPSDMSGSEYQANADLGLTVRCTLALNAAVRLAKVQLVARQGDSLVVATDRGQVRTQRVVVATGIGRRNGYFSVKLDKERLISFERFMRRFDLSMFPLRGLGRVAVVGAGDSGRTAIEALTGYGPYMGGSVASLDYVPRIDWYGVGEDMTKERWLECNRTRYKPLAALFQDRNRTVQNARVTPRERLRTIVRTLDEVQVNGRAYDTVISCIGFNKDPKQVDLDLNDLISPISSGSFVGNDDKGTILGKGNADRSVVVVGPAADLDFTGGSDPAPQVPQNKVALFRLAPRTSALASLVT